MPASGATPWRKEDLESEEYLYQHKHTDRKSITVSRKALTELRQNAIDVEKEPAFVLDYGDQTWVAITKEQFDYYRTIEAKWTFK